MALKDTIGKYQEARKKILWATRYDNVLYRGSGGDSSENAEFAMTFVREAEKRFIEHNQDEILQLAARIIEGELC